jgi:zinc/manganese transport system substrate-binding protein
MKRIQWLLPVLLLLLGLRPAGAALRIIATTPDLADVTRQIGGDQVKVESLAKGTEDIHAVPQRPSFVPKLNQADAVVLIGLEAEHAFLPALIDVAQNPKILRGHPGYIDCSENVAPLDVPTVVSRTEGEQHPFGNPHYNIDPRKGGLIADAIAKGLSRIDPAHAALYAANRDTFKKTLAAKMDEWGKLATPVRGKKAVSFHPDMSYFAEYLGLDLVGTIELKPGIPPTPKHLEVLAQQMKEEKVPLIIREVQYSPETAQWLAAQTNAKIATVATIGGAFPDSGTYFGMIQHNIQVIVDALK